MITALSNINKNLEKINSDYKNYQEKIKEENKELNIKKDKQ